MFAGILASRDFVGPRKALECKEGFFRAYTDSVRAADLVDGFGETFVILEVGFKPHSACRYVHGAIDAAHHLRNREHVRSADVETIVVHMSELAVRQASVFPCPNLSAAMGSTQFSVALAFVRGSNGLKDYRDGFQDETIHALARKVVLQVEPTFGIAGRQTILEVRMSDGRGLEYLQKVPKGEPHNPLTADELEQKFFATAGMAIEERQAHEINEMIMRLESEPHAGDVLPLTVVPVTKTRLHAAHV